jgi:glycosyltransferase involved in cell wall biosynthesis
VSDVCKLSYVLMTMRILFTVDPEIAVPPTHYGGIERIVDMLIRKLGERGHDVVLLANKASAAPCKLIAFPGDRSQSIVDTVCNTYTVARTLSSENVDVVHSFGRLAYLLPVLPLNVPKLMTYQRKITHRSVRIGNALSRNTLHFSAISKKMMEAYADERNWHLVYNGVPLEKYLAVDEVPVDAPLVFLGRIEPIKGAHVAIEIAKKSRRRLVIAGNVPSGYAAYFDACIAPHIDGETVEYLGPVNDAQKNALLGSATAFLMPIQWEEPFGIVMAEALACGTPVIGFARGAVPEVVSHGETGFVCSTVEQAVAFVAEVTAISRKACRTRAERLFGDDAVTDAYLNVYERLLSRVN